MLRPLISASLLAIVLAQPALAQTADPLSTQLQQSGLTPPTVLSQGYTGDSQDTLVTKLLNQTVYTSAEDDAKQIGTIKDIVVTSDIGISAVVLSVGGFLGVGSKDVAVDFHQLDWLTRPDGSRRWVLESTAEDLRAAPAFIWSDSVDTTGKPALTPAEEEAQLVPGDPNAAPIDPTLTTDQPERQAITTPIDRTGFTNLDQRGLSSADLVGIPVYGVDNEQIGTIGNVLSHTDGTIDALIVDVGGFLGLGAKSVAVGYDNLAFSTDTSGNRYLFLNTSRDQLEAQPTYNPQTYASDSENQRMVVTP